MWPTSNSAQLPLFSPNGHHCATESSPRQGNGPFGPSKDALPGLSRPQPRHFSPVRTIRVSFTLYTYLPENVLTNTRTGMTLPARVLLGGTMMLPGNTSLPDDAILDNGEHSLGSITLPAAIELPGDLALPGGICLPSGCSLPAKSILPAGTSLPNGSVLPKGTGKHYHSPVLGLCLVFYNIIIRNTLGSLLSRTDIPNSSC